VTEEANASLAALRDALAARARLGGTISYKQLADQLGLEPPLAIHQLTVMLEATIKQDAVANRPLLASLCVSKTPPRIPRPGFFLAARDAGLFTGPLDGADAAAFHSLELQRAIAFYAATG
jgi:hypothetical protein